MAILGTRLLARQALPGNTVVATVMSNLGLERVLAARNGTLLRAAVGDRYVVEAMRDKGFVFGGEQSGHIIFLRKPPPGTACSRPCRCCQSWCRRAPAVLNWPPS